MKLQVSMVILLDPRSLLPLQVDVQAAFAKSGLLPQQRDRYWHAVNVMCAFALQSVCSFGGLVESLALLAQTLPGVEGLSGS